MMYSLKMKNITLNIIGQRILADVLKEKEDIIKMNILFFENLGDYLKNIKDNIIKNIVVTHLSNFESIEQSNCKIDNPIKLSANESALGPSPKAIQAFEKDKDKIFKYPESDSNSLREVLSEKFNIDSKRIICGSGSDQIFDLTCHLFLEPGDEVIVTEFGFIMHRIYASLYKAKVILAKEKNFKASVDEILKKVTNKTKIVFIANPNNPTGTY